ncbi:pilus assembly protein PilW [Moraxella osloensis]|uniref:Pilus assembly protein PilW n=2 Tax=Faucicola osloensis TaxID=34062 RepID=A0A2I1RFC7_FAUOS|nr:pilus assembly protein PilW [Moraxella osloensis]
MLHYGGILMISSYRSTSGFTLIELMISLVLGLLISAAVIQVYLTNTKTASTQKSGSELQDASVFGLQQLESHLRLANLGNSVTSITDKTVGGGIVISPENIGLASSDTSKNLYFTRTGGDSNITGINSDQLTIQFKNTTGVKIPDCESADIDPKATVIERYFIRSSSTTGQGLLLACDAGRVTDTGITGLSANYQSGGSEVILGVDQFKILLGIQTDAPSDAGLMRYLTASEYLALSGTKPPITAVKIGLIVRGSSPVIGSDVATSFKLLGATQPLKSGQPKLVRTTYESTTLLRNARVINIDTSTTLTAGS